MKFSSLTIGTTAVCNYTCSYCYQFRDFKRISKRKIKKILDFFFPLLKKRGYINFFGGEPLLEIDNIRWALEYIEKKEKKYPKNLRFSTTSNGSLITDEILEMFNKYKFEMLLSFDGLAQEMERQPGSFEKTVDVIKKIQHYPDINLETNSVFTTRTVHMLSDSLQFMTSLGVSQISHTLNSMEKWTDESLHIYQEQIQKTSVWSMNYYKTYNAIPVNLFRDESDSDESSGIFRCEAGRDRVAIAPDSTIWGCHRIADYYQGKEDKPDYKKYCFGSINEFFINHKNIYNKKIKEYAKLQMDHFWTEDKLCAQCEDLIQCSHCPFSAENSQVVIGKIPTWVCKINHIEKKVKTKFQEIIKKKG